MAIIQDSISSYKDDILSFCKDTFSWGDYIHEVWNSWVKDGGLVVYEDNKTAIAMCHAVKYDSERMLWIEGIRVKEEFRKKGIAIQLIKHFEKIAKDSGILQANMLIETENLSSLNLAKKLNYKIISQWNYYSLGSKKNSNNKIKFASIDISELYNFKGIRFVDSWRWIPLVKSNFNILKSQGNILCLKKDDVIQSLGVISESSSYHDTIILTIIFGTIEDIYKIISYTQNLAMAKKYSKIRILTERDDLIINNIGNKFPFYLLGKTL